MNDEELNEYIKKLEEKLSMLEFQASMLRKDLKDLRTAFIKSLLQERAKKQEPQLEPPSN